MKPICRRTGRRGYTLFALVTTLMLLGVFSLIATKLFVSTLRVTRSANDSQNQAARIDHMIRMLRADVWSATDARTIEKKLVIERAGGKTVTWSAGDHQTIVRTEEGSPQANRWAEIGSTTTFDGRGDCVAVTVEDGPFRSKREMLLVSQVRLANREGK